MNKYDKTQKAFLDYPIDPKAAKLYKQTMWAVGILLFAFLALALGVIVKPAFYSTMLGTAFLYIAAILISLSLIFLGIFEERIAKDPKLNHDYQFYAYKTNNAPKNASNQLTLMAAQDILLNQYDEAAAALSMVNPANLRSRQHLTYERAMHILDDFNEGKLSSNVEYVLFPKQKSSLRYLRLFRIILILIIAISLLGLVVVAILH